jgi:hypothetical protein
MKNIIGKVRFDAQTKITNGNFIYHNYSQNPEYIKMLRDGNFIDVTEEQYQFIRSNNNNGIEVCVIDGKLQVYAIPESEKLVKLKQDKLGQIKTLKKSILYAPLKYKTFILTASERAQNNIVGSLIVPFEKIKWLDASGNVVELSYDEFKEIRNIIAERSFLCYKTEARLIKQISTSEKIADTENIDIESEFAKINKIIEIA